MLYHKPLAKATRYAWTPKRNYTYIFISRTNVYAIGPH